MLLEGEANRDLVGSSSSSLSASNCTIVSGIRGEGCQNDCPPINNSRMNSRGWTIARWKFDGITFGAWGTIGYTSGPFTFRSSMNLTPRQQNMISVFLRHAANDAEQFSPDERARMLGAVKARVRKELESLGGDLLADDQVAAALRRCQPAGYTKPSTSSEPELDLLAYVDKANACPEIPTPLPIPPSPRSNRPSTGAVRPVTRQDAPTSDEPQPTVRGGWLGVCRHLSDRTGLDMWFLRAVFLVLGLTGPIALAGYIAVYVALYMTSRQGTFPQMNVWRVLRSVAGGMTIALALYGSARGLFFMAGEGVPRFLGKPLETGQWAWLDTRHNVYLAWLLFLAMPISVMSGLPLANDWDRTAKRLVQAGLAVYAAVLSFGIASLAVGIILMAVEEISL